MDPNANDFSPRAISGTLSSSGQVTAPSSSGQITAPPLRTASSQFLAPRRPFRQASGLRHSLAYPEAIQHPPSHEQGNRFYQNNQQMNMAPFEPQTAYRNPMNEAGRTVVPNLPWTSPEYRQRTQHIHHAGPVHGNTSFTSPQVYQSGARNDSVARANVFNPQFKSPQQSNESIQFSDPSTPVLVNEASNTPAMMVNESSLSGRTTPHIQVRSQASVPTRCSNWILHGKCDGSDGRPPPKGTDEGRQRLASMEEFPGTNTTHDRQGPEQDDQATTRWYESRSPALHDVDSGAQRPFMVGPHANSFPYELRALIYSIVWKCNRVSEEANFPLAHMLSRASSPATVVGKDSNPIGDAVKGLIRIIHDSTNQMDTYRAVIRIQQPRLLEFSRILKTASNGFKEDMDQAQKLEIIRRASDDISSTIRRHRVSESFNAFLRDQQNWYQENRFLAQ